MWLSMLRRRTVVASALVCLGLALSQTAWAVGLRVEGEAFGQEAGGHLQVLDGPAASGGRRASVWDARGHRVAWRLNVPAAGGYLLGMRYGLEARRSGRRVLVDGRSPLGNQDWVFPVTGGWQTWRLRLLTGSDNEPVILRLTSGDHVISLENTNGQGLSVDYLELQPQADPQWEARAELKQLTIRHPRAEVAPLLTDGIPVGLYFKRSDIPALRQRVRPGVPRAIFAALKARADALVDDWDMADIRSNSPLLGAGPAWAVHDNVPVLALTYVLTGDARYGDAAREAMLAACEVPHWYKPDEHGLPADTPDLSTGLVLVGLAMGADWVDNLLSDQERQTILGNIAEKGVAECLRFALDPAHRGSMNHNWAGIMTGGAGLGALVLNGRHARGASYLAECTAVLKDRLDALYAVDGGTTEGCGYGWFGAGHFFYFIEALRCVTGENLLAHPGYRRQVEFSWYLQSPAMHTRGSADLGYWGNSGAPPALALRFAQVNGDLAAGEYFRRFYGAGATWPADADSALALVACQTPIPAALPRYPLSRHFAGINWVVLRTGFDFGAIFAMSKSSDWHADAGQLLLDAYGEHLAIDSGFGGYHENLAGYYVSSPAHNVALINGAGVPQSWGSPRGTSVGGKAITEVWLDRAGQTFDYFLADRLRETGAEVAARAVDRRHFLYLRPDLLVTVDECAMKADDAAFTWLLHTDNRDGQGTVSRVGEQVRVRRPKAGLDLLMVMPAEVTYRLTQDPVNGVAAGSNTLRFGAGLPPPPTPITPGNLCPNPGFEDGGAQPSPWTVWVPEGAGQATWDQDQKRSGRRSLRLTGDPAGRVMWYFDSAHHQVPMHANASYRLRMFIRASDLASGAASADLIFNAAGDREWDRRSFALDTGTYDWKPAEVSFQAPAGVAALRELRVCLSGRGTLWVDDVSLEETAPAQHEGRPMRSTAFFAAMCPYPVPGPEPRLEAVRGDQAALARLTRHDGSVEEVVYNASGQTVHLAGIRTDARLAVVRRRGGRITACGIVGGGTLATDDGLLLRTPGGANARLSLSGDVCLLDTVLPSPQELAVRLLPEAKLTRITARAGRSRRRLLLLH
jgi:hypothetical protein